MGKPLSRPDCLRQNPRCLGKGDDEEAYIEDCYVPQRSIYDTMRINEQIDQGSKISQPSRSTLGSGGGEGSTLSSNGTLGVDIGGVFVARGGSTDAGVKRLDERVIFDALKLSSDPQSMSPVGAVAASVIIPTSNSAAVGAAVVTKRRHHGTDKKDNPNRRSWKAFMPPTYPEFAERLELSPVEGGEKRLSGAGIPVTPHHPLPSLLAAPATSLSTPPLPLYSPSSASPSNPQIHPASNSPAITSSLSPMSQHPPLSVRQKQSPQLQPHHPKHIKFMSAAPSTLTDQPPLQTISPTQTNSCVQRQSEKSKGEKSKVTVTPLLCVRSVSEEQPQHWDITATKTSDSERDSPLLEQDQDTAPLIPPKPVFCPPTKARTWPRSMRGVKKSLGHGGVLHNLPILPPLPPLLGEDSDLEEESLYLLDPPSPFLKEGEGLSYGGLPLSPCLSQEGGEEGLLGWLPSTGELRERTASELRFEEDERRILEELDGEENEQEQEQENKNKKERIEMEERNWQAVLKLESHETTNISWEAEGEESQLLDWETKQLSLSGSRSLLTPPIGFGGSRANSVSPCPSSEAGSEDLFLELERQCLEEEGEESSDLETTFVSLFTEPLNECHTLPRVEEEEEDREDQIEVNGDEISSTMSTDHINHTDPCQTEPCGLQTDKNLPSEDTDHTQNCGAIESRDQSLEELSGCSCHDSDSNVSSLPGLTSNIPGAETLDGPLLESYSSGIQMSLLERTALSDITETDCDRPETDSDLDSAGSSEQEQVDEEEVIEKDEVLVDYTASCHQDASPSTDNVYEKDAECELDICKSPLNIEDFIQPSIGSSYLASDIGKEAECNNCQTVSHVETKPVDVSIGITSDQEGMLLISETAVAEMAIALPDMSVHEWELTNVVQVTTSTPKSDTSTLPVNALSKELSSPSPLSYSTTQEKCERKDHEKDTDAFVATDSFVYLAVAVPPQYSQDCPPSPLVESTPPSPLPKPCPDPEEGAFLSSDSFVYLAAPERLALVSDGGSACEDCQDLDSESETSQSGVDFVLGSMTGDSDWESDGSRPDLLHPYQDQWGQLEPGILDGLFREAEHKPENQGVPGPHEKDIGVAYPSNHPDDESSLSECFSFEVKNLPLV